MSEPARFGSRRITLDIVAQLAGRTLNIGLGVVATIALVRGLGVNNYGEWSTLFAVAGLVDAIGSQAMDRVAVPRAAEDPESKPLWLGALVRSRWLWMFPSLFLVVVLVLVISTSANMRITGLVVALTVPAGALSSLAVVFQLKLRNDVNVLIVTLNSVLWTTAVLVLTFGNAGLLPFAIAFTAIAFITAGLQAVLACRATPIDFAGGKALTRKLIRLSIPVGLFGLAVTAYNRLDLLLLFVLAGARDAGFYSAVYRIVDQAGFVPSTFAITITPVLAMSYRTDLDRVRRLLQSAADHLAVVSFGALGFTIVAGAPLLEALYGPEFGQAAPAFVLLMGNYVVICFATVLGTMVVTLNLQRKLVPYALITVAANTSLNLALIPPFGYMGAAAVAVATEALILALTFRLLQPHLHLRPRFDRVIRVALAAAVMSVCVWLERRAGAGLAVLMVSSLLIYAPLLFILRAVQIDDLMSMIRTRAAA